MKQFLSRLFRWEKGRQNTGYDKMLLGGGLWPNPFDMYLLRFSEGQEIPPHVDRVKSGEHYRLNLVLKQAKSGGQFRCSDPIYESARVKYFRSDVSEHSVSRVLKGSRYVLSIGWIKNGA
ncbi:2OG-Fe(II) oxygenase [Saccharospirillum impatiens]|uniref:2OG-Fe(II) oxygenase n=1 Tax=Saccharospirillum impatiens TaxID=169438 RepID=UPI00042390B9|nr:2OG-Fe(II) oxygenase [Saccharospirillum impatiens]